MSMKAVLLESRQTMEKTHDIDLTSIHDFRNMIVSDDQFETYKASLMESIQDQNHVMDLENMVNATRVKLLESINSTYNITPYETLALPLLFAFYPRLISKEIVTVRPINAPDTLMPYMRFQFVDHNGVVVGDAPYYNNVSYGPSVTEADDAFVSVGETDVLDDHGHTSDVTSIERTMKFYKIKATKSTSTEEANINVAPTVDGNFFGVVTFPSIGTLPISGKIDFANGTVYLMSADPTFTDVELYYTCTFSLEQNTMNNKIKPGIDKVRMIVEDQEISADWTIQLEQDYNALFDIDIQSHIIDILGKQMALDVDNRVLGHIFSEAALLPTSHKETFDRTPPSGYTLGPIYWYQNILEKLTKLSAQIYSDTNIGEGNVIAANPVDAAIFESLNKFSFDGKGADGGSLGYSTGSLAQRWKVYSSPIVPQGEMALLHKPTDVLSSIYVFAPYQPAVMSPYPLGRTPSLTILSRNARKFYRPLGAALLEVTQS
jgi:hypothetical protein